MTHAEPWDFCRTENFPSRKPEVLSLLNGLFTSEGSPFPQSQGILKGISFQPGLLGHQSCKG